MQPMHHADRSMLQHALEGSKLTSLAHQGWCIVHLQETVLEVEYFKAVVPPQLKTQLPHDDWYSFPHMLQQIQSL